MLRLGLWLRRGWGALRTAWLLTGVTLLLLAALELGLRAMFTIADQDKLDTRVAADGYRESPWAAEHFDELAQLRLVWRPYVYYRRVPYVGQTINIDDGGHRRTWRPETVGARERSAVLVFGGSTIWGTGARDDYTVPSQLAQMLAERGRPTRVMNMGESGYVSGQGVAALIEALGHGARPDVVIFYDGVNDVYAARQSGVAGIPQNEHHRELEFNAMGEPGQLARLALGRPAHYPLALLRLAGGLGRRWAPSSPDEDPVDPDAILAAYVANVRVVQALARSYGFKALFYWQPVLFTKPDKTPYERGWVRRSANVEALFNAVYGGLSGDPQLAELTEFSDLSRLFSNVGTPMYIDLVHLTEAGNAAVAGAMIDALHAALPPPTG